MKAANGFSHPKIEMEQRWQVFTLVGTAWNKVPVQYGKNRPALACHKFDMIFILSCVVGVEKYG
jgi:hypothetical protein